MNLLNLLCDGTLSTRPHQMTASRICVLHTRWHSARMAQCSGCGLPPDEFGNLNVCIDNGASSACNYCVPPRRLVTIWPDGMGYCLVLKALHHRLVERFSSPSALILSLLVPVLLRYSPSQSEAVQQVQCPTHSTLTRRAVHAGDASTWDESSWMFAADSMTAVNVPRSDAAFAPDVQQPGRKRQCSQNFGGALLCPCQNTCSLQLRVGDVWSLRLAARLIS